MSTAHRGRPPAPENQSVYTAHLAQLQARLEAQAIPIPNPKRLKTRLASIARQAAQAEAAAQAALWRGDASAYHNQMEQARALYDIKRWLWGWRYPGEYLKACQKAARTELRRVA